MGVGIAWVRGRCEEGVLNMKCVRCSGMVRGVGSSGLAIGYLFGCPSKSDGFEEFCSNHGGGYFRVAGRIRTYLQFGK